MGRRTWRQDENRLRAAADDGVIRVAELQKLGVSRAVTYDRCRPGGPWQLLLPGVVLLSSGHPTGRQRLRAALLFGGREAQLSGAAAADLYGVRSVAGCSTVQLLIPHRDRRRAVGFVAVERTTRLPAPISVRGFPCAPPTRAVLDHARTLREHRLVQALLAEAVQRKFCTAEALLDELDAGSSRGTALVRHELQDVLGGARSVAEIRAKRIARRSGLPEPLWNVVLEDEFGNFVGNPDAWFADVGLAWEIDSREYHQDPEQYARTLRRNARYAVHGVPFLPTLPSRLYQEESEVLSELGAAYEQAALVSRSKLIVVRAPESGGPSRRAPTSGRT